MKIVAYIRVSTTGQDLSNQKLAILDYAHRNKMTVNEFVEVTMSSQQPQGKRRIDETIAKLAEGDTLLVSELSRLGRSLGQIIQILDTLVKQKIKFIAIKESISFDGKQDLKTKVMIALFGLFAEVERDLISERTKEGLAAARMKGKLLGRPKGAIGKSKLDGKEPEIKIFLQKKVSKASIAKIMDISRTALYHFIESRHLAAPV
jgi:DNA invertase Pin-like site-specific DNA recombinase